MSEDVNLDLLSACYLSLGKEMSHVLIGDFAFALMDERNATYFCARDPLGHAAFFYTFLNGSFLPAASLKELLSLLPEKPKPSIHAMKEFLWYGVNPEETMYEGIYRLPPGHRMTVRGAEVEVSRYWDPKSIKTDYSITIDEASDRFLELFKEAVSCRLDIEGTTGCDLSGGLDSSSIYCVAKQEGADMEAYSMRFGEMECDEGAYIDDVLAEAGGKAVSLSEEKLDYRDRYSLHYHYTYAPHWPNAHAATFSFPVLERMQENGIRVALSGQGGDHVLFGSLHMPFDLLMRGEFQEFFREFHLLGKMRKTASNRFIKELLRPILPTDMIRKLRSVFSGREIPPPRTYRNYTEDYYYANSFSQKEMISFITGAGYSRLADSSLYRAAEEYYGIVYRHPFFDIRVVEFLLSLPPEYLYSSRQYRRLHRKAMKGILPESVRMRRNKAEFGDILKQQIDAVVADSFWKDPHIVHLGIVTQRLLNESRSNYDASPIGYDRKFYWKLLNLEQWYRSNYDPEHV